jgi:hypothetical protein
MRPFSVLANQGLAFLTLAQRARCATAILRRDDADIVRLGATLPLTFAQRAR